MASSSDPITVHGWTAVPRDTSILLGGKEYIHKPEPLLIKDMKFPSEDPLVTRIQEYAREKLPPQTYNHSMRVYYFATAILHQQFPSHATTLSPSTLALATLLHDIGTTPSNLRTTRLSFEFHGGLLAHSLLLQRATSSSPAPAVAQAESVAEAIWRHQDLGMTGTITLLGQLLQLATLHDNVGGNPGLVHAATRADAHAAFPRHGWARCFAGVVRDEVGLKPWAHTTALGVDEFPAAVLGNGLMAEFDDEVGGE